MLRSFKIAFLTLLVLLPLTTWAQETQPQKQPVDEQAVRRLITTLESETARTEFINNLKMLLDQQQEKDAAEETLTPLTQSLGVESFTGQLIQRYQDFLERNDLKGSTIGKIALSGGAAIIIFLLAFFVRKTITRGLQSVDRYFQKIDLPAVRMRLYGRTLRNIATILMAALFVYGCFIIWAPAKYNIFEQDWFKTILKAVFNIGFVVFLGALLWELVNMLIQIIFRKVSGTSSARALTIMPIIRNILFMVFSLLFLLILLSELGINIMPLLAGAGIVGVAIGFGAQTMVRDFLTGFTIIMEDVMRVGDVVQMAGHAGVVEKITLRKVQLRDFGGRVFTIPFSEIKTIENQTKDFSFYPIDIGVSYNADTDKVIEVMRAVDAELRADPTYAADMIDPIDIAGVDAFADSAVIIKARLKTQPLRQWVVGREYNRRLKKAFDREGIEIPFPQRVVTIREEK